MEVPMHYFYSSKALLHQNCFE